jgi:hypothetical protein
MLAVEFLHVFHHHCDYHTSTTATNLTDASSRIPTRLPSSLRFLHVFHYYYSFYIFSIITVVSIRFFHYAKWVLVIVVVIGGGMVVIGGVFVYFEILARCPRVRVRSAEVCFNYTFIINSTTNRLINMHSIKI